MAGPLRGGAGVKGRPLRKKELWGKKKCQNPFPSETKSHGH